MTPPRDPRALAFLDIKVFCPHCQKARLQYYGKPDWAAFVRDQRPIRFWCPKCERKFDANIKPGITPEEDERSFTEVKP